MSILVLTQTGGILKPFAIILGFIMNYIYRFLQIFGINNVALTIILFTLVINVLMIPLTVKQQKFSKMSSLMNPELQKVQKKYQNRKDEKSMRMMQAETQAIYDKYGASPTGGCLPMLIQLPILFALYRVIYNVPAYVEPVREIYEHIAQPIMSASGAGDIMTTLIKEMSLRVSNFDISNINKIIDALYVVKSTGWSAVSDAFSGSADVVSAISQYSTEIIHINSIPGWSEYCRCACGTWTWYQWYIPWYYHSCTGRSFTVGEPEGFPEKSAEAGFGFDNGQYNEYHEPDDAVHVSILLYYTSFRYGYLLDCKCCIQNNHLPVY